MYSGVILNILPPASSQASFALPDLIEAYGAVVNETDDQGNGDDHEGQPEVGGEQACRWFCEPLNYVF